jgi:hypothetical protein
MVRTSLLFRKGCDNYLQLKAEMIKASIQQKQSISRAMFKHQLLPALLPIFTPWQLTQIIIDN